MIHENIGYGYKFDDETKTIIGGEHIKDYGFFSTFTLMLVSIINVYKDLDMIVENVDGRNLLKHLRQDEDIDMFHHFFNINKPFCRTLIGFFFKSFSFNFKLQKFAIQNINRFWFAIYLHA